jgi:hypothetical protein
VEEFILFGFGEFGSFDEPFWLEVHPTSMKIEIEKHSILKFIFNNI